MKKFIKLAKNRQNVSQNGLAKLLGMTGGGLSHIANGATASDETIVKLARLAGVKPETILAEQELAKPLKPEVKAMWERIGGQAAVWFLVVSLGVSVALHPVAGAMKNNLSILC